MTCQKLQVLRPNEGSGFPQTSKINSLDLSERSPPSFVTSQVLHNKLGEVRITSELFE